MIDENTDRKIERQETEVPSDTKYVVPERVEQEY